MALAFKVLHEFNPDVNYKHIIGSLIGSTTYTTPGEIASINGLTNIVYLNVPSFRDDANAVYISEYNPVTGKLRIIVEATGAELADGAYPAGIFANARFYAIAKTSNVG